MSSWIPATRHPWQASFKTHWLAQPFARHLDRRIQLSASCRTSGFSLSAQGLAQKKVGSLPTPKRPTTPNRSQTLISASRKPAAYEPLTDKLALRASPTLLYRASSYTNYLFGCYAAGAGLLAAAWSNFQTRNYAQLGDVPSWVPVFTGVGSLMIACGGVWMLLRPQNMVRAISCLPSSPKAGLGSRSLLLQIERVPTFPFKQPKLVTVPPGDVTISAHVFNDNAEQKLEATITEMARREEQLYAFAKSNLLTLPFRQAAYWIWRGFVGIKSAFTGGGFHYLHIRGNIRAWKIKKDPEWALDDGRALDKLVRIKLG